MFGLGFSEILVILAVALIFLGPERLPEAAKTLGKALGEFRRTLDEVRREINITDSYPPPVERPQQLAASALRAEVPPAEQNCEEQARSIAAQQSTVQGSEPPRTTAATEQQTVASSQKAPSEDPTA